MGCWNKTCGVTQFPLFSGDETVNFILVQTGWDDRNYCNPSSLGWQMIPIPFYGEYNDYGWQDDDDGQQAKYDFLREFYKDKVVENEKEVRRARSCYPPMPNGPFENNAILGDAIHGDVWRIKYSDRELEIASMMVSRKVWDALTKSVTIDYPKETQYTISQLADVVNEYRAYSDVAYEEMILELAKQYGHPELTMETIKKLAASKRLIAQGDVAMRFNDQRYPNESFLSPIRAVVHAIASFDRVDSSFATALSVPLDAGVITAEDAVAMTLFNRAMNALRKPIIPQVGEGSQEGFGREHSVLLNVMQNIIKDYEQERSKWA